jgi:peptidoglycan/xylan/chitin deacetylase (PgdA/CDA1 family)
MNFTQKIKALLGYAEKIFGAHHESNELLVICMHSTPFDRMNDFKSLIRELDKSYKYLPAKDLSAFFLGNYVDGPYYTLSFDDGLMNNYHTALWLAESDKSATYFVVPDFIESPSQAEYYQSKIRPIINKAVDHEIEDITAMSWMQLKELVEKGHVIGAHSASHTLNTTMSENDLYYEIIDAQKRIELQLGAKITTIASPNNTLTSVNSSCAKMIKENYKMHFTTVPGTFTSTSNPYIIYRRNFEVDWNKGAILFALGRWDLWRWTSAQKLLARLLS